MSAPESTVLTTDKQVKDQPFSMYEAIIYGLPQISATSLFAGVNIVSGIYSKYFGVSLAAIAAVVFFARFFDLLIDPVIGRVADRFQARHGTRKPMILWGGVGSIIFSVLLFIPHEGVGIFYFALCFAGFYLFWTIFEIPHIAWGGQLSTNPDHRTRIYSMRGGFSYVGSMLFYAIPMLPFFVDSSITPETLKWSTYISCSSMAVFILLCIKYLPDISTDQSKIVRSVAMDSTPDKGRFLDVLLDIKNNPPFLFFLLAFLCSFFGVGMWYGLIFIYVDSYLNMGPSFAEMFFISFVAGIISTPLWYKLSTLIGKRNAWLIALILVSISFLYTGFLRPDTVTSGKLIVIKLLNTLGFVCTTCLAPAILSDILAKTAEINPRQKDATCFAIYTMTYKIALALGGAFSLGMAAFFGFDPAMAEHSEASITGARWSIAWVPGLIVVISMAFVAALPRGR